MSQDFEHLATAQIIECNDFLSALPCLAVKENILLVSSKGFVERGIIKQVVEKLGTDRVYVFDEISPNPEKSHLQTSFIQFDKKNIQQVIALGGGSVIDAAKVFCAMLSYPNTTLDNLLLADNITNQVNLVGIPTTSGTGAEVTPFATVWQSATASKFSLYGIRPNVVLLDPSLTLSLSFEQTLYPALDALSHALESLWNHNKTKKSQEYALVSIKLICSNLRQVLHNPSHFKARQNLQKAATYSGLAISTTKTAIAHAISYPLTLQYGIPHGLACSFTLGAILSEQKANELGMPEHLKQSVFKLINSLQLDQEIKHFLTFTELLAMLDQELDPSRADNFTKPVNKQWLVNILGTSWSPNLESGIET